MDNLWIIYGSSMDNLYSQVNHHLSWINRLFLRRIFNNYLVGGIPTPLKNMKVSWFGTNVLTVYDSNVTMVYGWLESIIHEIDKPIYTGWWLRTNPSEKYEFVSWDDEIPNIWENKIHVPNRQPVISWFGTTKKYSWKPTGNHKLLYLQSKSVVMNDTYRYHQA